MDDKNTELKQAKVELQLAKDQIINLESRCKTLLMENMEMKDELAGKDNSKGRTKSDWDLNIKAAPFEPK